MKVTGFSENEVMETVGDGGHTNTAFVIGIILGALTYSLSPLMIILAAAAMVWAYLVLLKPEIGVLTLFFAMPILPTMVLAAVVVYTTFSWSVKLLRGKRMIKIEPVDIMALAFIVMIAMGGFISLSGSSLKPALLMACLGFGYILTVELITSREWIVKCATAFVTAATLIAAYGIFLLMIGGGYSSDAWTDSDMFSEWGGRAVSTLENPNMLGEYLILALPIGFSMFIGRGEGLRRISALFSVGIMGVCLILSFSRGAWLGFLIAMVVYAFIWHGRALWGGFAVAAMLPFMRYILPASIFNRLTSIGNMADSSTSYRVYSWRASVEMIGDYLFSGIGIGEGAWQRVYPMYAYQGVEASPHSHNLFLQIWLYLGIFGILVFAVFIFMLFQSGFTMFSELSRCSQLKNTDISESLLEKNSSGNERMNKRNLIRQSKFQLRMSSAGVLCGILAALMQGITDYTWYNYRVYLMFWLACGLAAAYIRNGHSMIGEQAGHTEYDSTSCEIQIPVADCGKENRKNKRKTRQ